MARMKRVVDQWIDLVDIFRELEKVTHEKSVSLKEGMKIATRNVLLRRKIREGLRKSPPKCTVKFRLKDELK